MDSKVINTKSLGSIVRSARKEKGVSQSLAGESVGVDQSTLSALERGASNVRIETLFRVLSALNLELVVRTRGANSNSDEKDKW